MKDRSESVKVTEADKEAAVELAQALGISCEDFTSGAADVLVQHLARHSLAAMPWTAEDDPLTPVYLAGVYEGRKQERAAVMAWLSSHEGAWLWMVGRGLAQIGALHAPRVLAEVIARGDHLKGQS